MSSRLRAAPRRSGSRYTRVFAFAERPNGIGYQSVQDSTSIGRLIDIHDIIWDGLLAECSEQLNLDASRIFLALPAAASAPKSMRVEVFQDSMNMLEANDVIYVREGDNVRVKIGKKVYTINKTRLMNSEPESKFAYLISSGEAWDSEAGAYVLPVKDRYLMAIMQFYQNNNSKYLLADGLNRDTLKGIVIENGLSKAEAVLENHPISIEKSNSGSQRKVNNEDEDEGEEVEIEEKETSKSLSKSRSLSK